MPTHPCSEAHRNRTTTLVTCRRLAQGKRGGYVKLRVSEDREAHTLGAGRAAVLAECVVRLYEGQPCAPHTDIEEAYRAGDMDYV